MTPRPRSPRLPLRAALALAGIAMADPAAAQVTTRILAQPPDTPGFGNAVELMEGAGGVYTIDEATFGDRTGSNLFFSFEQFDVASGETALYSGNAADFVVSRVSGGSASQIFGVIDSDIAGADHIFVNPYGAVFGPDSSIEVDGSFHVTTADFLRFGDPESGPVWNTADCCSRLVSAAPPVAFGFSRSDAPSIHVDRPEVDPLAGTVPAGRTFSAVGGEVVVTGLGSGQRTLVARGGTIQLAAVRGPGDGGAVEVPLDLAQLDVDDIDPDLLGTVRIEAAAYLDTTNFRTGEPTIGRVVIRGGRLEVLGSESGFASVVDSGGAGVDPAPPPAIDVQVADTVVIDGGQLFASPFETGQGGDVHLEGTQLAANDAQIAIRNRADGVPGTLELDFDEIRLTGLTDIGSLAEGDATGADVIVSAGRLVAEGSGSFGALFSEAGRRGVQGGDLVLDVGELEVRSGARIGSSTTSHRRCRRRPHRERDLGTRGRRRSGHGGDLCPRHCAVGRRRSRRHHDRGGHAPAPGRRPGDRHQHRRRRRRHHRHPRRHGARAGRRPEQRREPLCHRGPLPVRGGAAGSVFIDASERVAVTRGGLVSVSSADVTAGASGDIEITTDRLRIADGGAVTTEAFSSEPDAGGDVRIVAASLLDVEDGEIRTNTPFSNAGDVSIAAEVVVLQGAGAPGETLVASAAGSGGNIAIDARGFFVSGGELLGTDEPGRFVSLDGGAVDSVLDASSRFDEPGAIEVTAPNAAVAGQLAVLSDAFYDREDLLTNQCEVQRAPIGSLVVRERDRIPAAPDEDLRILYTPGD